MPTSKGAGGFAVAKQTVTSVGGKTESVDVPVTGGIRENVNLVVAALGTWQQFYGGDYAVRAFATNWNGATVTMKVQEPDGATAYTMRNLADSADVTFTANKTQGIGLSSDATIRADLTGGPPTGLIINVSRLP